MPVQGFDDLKYAFHECDCCGVDSRVTKNVSQFKGSFAWLASYSLAGSFCVGWKRMGLAENAALDWL